MKTGLIATALFAATAAAVVLFPERPVVGAANPPAQQPPVQVPVVATDQRPRVEVVFALDTTGSMSGLIAAAKEKIWSIATTLAQAEHAPEIRMGLVAYRDRGDDYVTRVVDLSADLDGMYATLMDLEAGGGGDGPESVNAALDEAVRSMSWSSDDQTYRVVFLVGDAPPHMDYQDEPTYPEILAAAHQRGIVVNAIQCGAQQQTTQVWQHIAGLGQGRFFQVSQDGNAVAMATPYDEKLATLSASLDETRLYYGSAEEQVAHERKLAATAKLRELGSEAMLARRAAFNAMASGAANLAGDGDLVADVASGRVDLAAVPPAALPAPMQAMDAETRAKVVEETAERREALKAEINALARQRSDWLKQRVAERGGAEESLDHGIFDAVREQAAERGIRYEADALSY